MKQKINARLNNKKSVETIFKYLVALEFDIDILETDTTIALDAKREIGIDNEFEGYTCSHCLCISPIDYYFCPTCGEKPHKGNIQ